MRALQCTPSVATLSDGSVLAVGGWDANASPVASVEILDPNGHSWTLLPPLSTPRSQSTVTELRDGRILVAGGWVYKNGSDSWTASETAEVYNRTTNTWTVTGSMTTPRALAAEALMADDTVLVTGGDSVWTSTEGQAVLGTAEFYNPVTGTWTYGGVMSTPRASHFTVPLDNGTVLVAGGWSDGRELGLASADLYTPLTRSWTRLPDMPGAHAQGRALNLGDGRVVIFGGFDSRSMSTAAVELFDTNTSSWTRLAGLKEAVYWPSAVLLPDGRILVAGGWTDKAPSHVIEVLDLPAP
jgi:hypothetical protein